jgi:hypothetical protein
MMTINFCENIVQSKFLKTNSLAKIATAALALSVSLALAGPVIAQIGVGSSNPVTTHTGDGFENATTAKPASDNIDPNAPKRRENAGERDAIQNKGDKYSFDDNKGIAVKIDGKNSEVLMAEYVKCVADAKQSMVQKYLSTVPDSENSKKAYKPLIVSQCFNRQSFNLSELRFEDTLFRASFFDYLYRKNQAASKKFDFSTLPPAEYSSEYDGKTANLPGVTVVQRKFGDCVVRQAGQEVDTLLSVDIWAPEEKIRISSISSTMGTCLPDGAELKFSRTLLRGTLAESMYKFQQRLSQSGQKVVQ